MLFVFFSLIDPLYGGTSRLMNEIVRVLFEHPPEPHLSSIAFLIVCFLGLGFKVDELLLGLYGLRLRSVPAYVDFGSFFGEGG